MKLYQIVLKDIWSRKRRVLYATLGVVIGTMTVIGTLTIAVAGKAKIYNQLEKYGPNLTVVPAISNLDMKLGDLSMGTVSIGENYISAEKLPQIRHIADSAIRKELKIEDEGNIATLAPKLYVNTKVKDTSVMLVGIDPQEELNVKTWWEFKQGEYINQADHALVGAIAAQLLQFNIGDKIDVNGREVTVASILGETGANDDYQIFLPLVTLQQSFNKEGLLSSVDIRALCNACPVEMISNEINKEIPGVQALAVKQIAASEMGLVERMNMLMLALAGITLAVGLFGVVNTMITAVHERVKDIGIMRAVGASQGQIIRVFIYEAIVVGILGGIFGYAIGTLLAFAIGPAIFEGATIAFVPQYLPLSLALAAFIAIVATIYPAFRATKIRVADSFRSL
jgi:putative ABC transport system permease protein